MNIFKYIGCALAIASLCLSTCFTNLISTGSVTCHAERDYMQEWEDRKKLPIESNSIKNWPQGPEIGAECAILMDMDTHTVLYAKNIHKKMYPASTTKIMTCLLAMEHCNLDEELTFSYDAIHSVPLDGSRMGGVNEGDRLNLEHALYAVLVQSANDVANAVGEHIAEKLGKEKSSAEFAKIMNEKAKEIGCKNTNFANASGLFDENHYTSAYDLALIGSKFFSNDTLCKMSSTASYHIEPGINNPEDIWMASKNQLLEGKPYAYEYLLGSKTGFVSQSRQTLVSGAQKDGMRLVCVVFTEESPYQFEDTVTLFKYGFDNFQKLSINEHENKYQINNMDLFSTDNDLFGDSTPLILLQNNAYVTLPFNSSFDKLDSEIVYHDKNRYMETDKNSDNVIATINYSFSNTPVGKCDIRFSDSETPEFHFATSIPSSLITTTNTDDTISDSPKVIFINVKKLFWGILIAVTIIIVIVFFISLIRNYNFSPKGQSSRRRRRRRQEIRQARRRARISSRRFNSKHFRHK